MSRTRCTQVLLVIILCCSLSFPQVAKAQSIPTRDDGTPIVELCKLLYEEARGLYLVACTWYLVLPFIYTPLSNVIPEPQPPAPEPTPTPPSFANFDPDSDGLAIAEECPENKCDEYAYIIFVFEEDPPGTRRCENPYSATLQFSDDAGERVFIKTPYFVSLEPLENEFGYVAKVKKFTNSNTWTYSWNYDMAIWCAE